MPTPEEPVVTRTRSLDEAPSAITTVKMFAREKWHDASVYRREDLQPGDRLTGVAIIVEPTNTIVIEPNWCVNYSDRNYLILKKHELMGWQQA